MKIISWVVFLIVMIGVLLFFRAMISDLNRMRKKNLRSASGTGDDERKKNKKHLRIIK